jgi:hypothetical protein
VEKDSNCSQVKSRNGFYFYEKLLDRIYRIYKISIDHFPNENGQTLCARGLPASGGRTSRLRGAVNALILEIGRMARWNHDIIHCSDLFSAAGGWSFLGFFRKPRKKYYPKNPVNPV